MRNLYYVNRQSLNTDFNRNSATGGGLRTWVLARFSIVNICIYYFWACFVKFIRHSGVVPGVFAVKKWRIIYE